MGAPRFRPRASLPKKRMLDPMTKQKYQEALATITLLQERFPKTFFVREVKRKPLKIGIDRDVVAMLNGTLKPDELTNALRYYVSAPGYLAALRPNAVRVDLNGEPAGIVSDGAAKVADEQLASTLLNAAARREKRALEERPVVKPEAVVEKGPRRLTLSDLKTAYLARQKEAVR
jgi:ProP effector